VVLFDTTSHLKGVAIQVRYAIAMFALALLTVLGRAQTSNRALPDDNLAYPVLITYQNGNGSGFYINTPSSVYLVTAKHVLFDAQTGNLLQRSFDLLSYSKDLADKTPNMVSIDTTRMAPEDMIKHPTKDVVVIKAFSVIGDSSKPERSIAPQPGVVLQSAAKAGILGVSRHAMKKFDEILVGNEVILMGYPTSLGLQPMSQIDPRQPLLRKGIVAGINSQAHSIILDCPAYFGNSGGPVIEVDPEGLGHSFKIIGVVDQYVPYADGGKTFFIMANSGYSVAIPMDYVLELVR